MRPSSFASESFLARSMNGTIPDIRLPLGDPDFFFRTVVRVRVADAFQANAATRTHAVARDTAIDLEELLHQARGQTFVAGC